MPTIAERMTLVERPSGFDYLRLYLSVSIVAWHTIAISYGHAVEQPLWTSWWRPLPFFLVPSFFALSGFLVAGSLERNTIPAFLTLRILRIFPALTVEVLVSALLIGTFVTTLPLSAYFHHGDFWRYFLNMVGDIHYVLPGVFTDQPSPYVNLQLWTVPYELDCYAVITLLAVATLTRRPNLLFLAVMAGTLAYVVKPFIVTTAIRVDALQGKPLTICFLFGVTIYFLRSKIPYHVGLFAMAVAAYLATCYFPKIAILAALPVAYITVFIGMLNPTRNLLIRGANYSYGIYLYGYPVQQLVSYLFPTHRNPLFNFAVSLPLIVVLAMASWELIESPVLDRRKAVLALIPSMRRRRRHNAENSVQGSAEGSALTV